MIRFDKLSIIGAVCQKCCFNADRIAGSVQPAPLRWNLRFGDKGVPPISDNLLGLSRAMWIPAVQAIAAVAGRCEMSAFVVGHLPPSAAISHKS